MKWGDGETQVVVSTHSRPKAAAHGAGGGDYTTPVSTHSRPKAAATLGISFNTAHIRVSTHSRPKAAAIGESR